MLNVFRNEIFPQIPEFSNLRGHSRGNPRSDLIFMGGGGVPHIVCWNGRLIT